MKKILTLLFIVSTYVLMGQSIKLVPVDILRAHSKTFISIQDDVQIDSTLTVLDSAIISGSRYWSDTSNRRLSIGYDAGFGGTNSSFIGYEAGKGSTSINSTVFGTRAASYNIMSGKDNSLFGFYSGRLLTSGANNSFFGYSSGINNKIGQNNSAFGHSSMFTDTSGSNHSLFGYHAGYSLNGYDNATFLGYRAGYEVATNEDINSVLVGSNAGNSMNFCVYNNLIGHMAGGGTDSAVTNNGLGYGVLYKNFGGRMSALGHEAGYYDSSGTWSVYVGMYAGRQNRNSTSSVIIGGGAAESDSVGSTNDVKIGYHAAKYNKGSSDNVIIGYQADGNTTVHTASDKGVIIGSGAGFNNNADNNIFLGYRSGYTNTTGYSNLFAGYESAYLNETGRENVFLGMQSGYDMVNGLWNSSVGYRSLYNLTSANFITANGYQAGFRHTIGDSSVYIGAKAGFNQVTGSRNTFVGMNAGYGTIAHNKSGCVNLGFDAGALSDASNLLFIDNSSTSTPLIWGDFANDSLRFNAKVSIDTLFSSYIESPVVNATDYFELDGDTALYVSPDNSLFVGTDAIRVGTENTVIGVQAGNSLTSSADRNFYGGYQAGYSNVSGDNNVGIGTVSLYSGVTLSQNFGLGSFTGRLLTSGSGNFFGGYNAASNLITATDNIFIGNTTGAGAASGVMNYNIGLGREVLRYGNGAQFNIALGYQAMLLNVTGDYNIAIGTIAGDSLLGDNNILIGHNVGGTWTGSDRLMIDMTNTQTPLLDGDFSTNTLNINDYLNVGEFLGFIDDVNTGVGTNGSGVLDFKANNVTGMDIDDGNDDVTVYKSSFYANNAYVDSIGGTGTKFNIISDTLNFKDEDITGFVDVTDSLPLGNGFIRSNPAIGTLSDTSANTETISVADTYYTLDGMEIVNDTNVTATDSTIGILRYGYYACSHNLSLTMNDAGALIHVSLFVNDVEIKLGGESEVEIPASGDVAHCGTQVTIFLNRGDVVKWKAKAVADTGTITVYHSSFEVRYVN